MAKKTIAEFEREIATAYAQGNNEIGLQLEEELSKAYSEKARITWEFTSCPLHRTEIFGSKEKAGP